LTLPEFGSYFWRTRFGVSQSDSAPAAGDRTSTPPERLPNISTKTSFFKINFVQIETSRPANANSIKSLLNVLD
jgi:hypothetical protein